MISKEKIKSLAAEAGISEIGTTLAEPLQHMKVRLQKRILENRITPFEEANPDNRLAPGKLLSNCRSIITMAIPYTPKNQPSISHPNAPTGFVARCARIVDYHRLVEFLALKFIDSLKKSFKENINCRFLCDSNPLLERELAKQSGIGWIGKNCTLINKRYGSYTVLGNILLDREVEPDNALALDNCRGCNLCLEKCPTGALAEPYTLNPYRCISYLNQAAGIVPRDLRSAFGNRLYGCDTCLEACPQNEGIQHSPYREAAFHLFPANPLLIPLLSITQREFDQTIALTAAGWRGKTTLQRNAIIALGNSRSEKALKPLARLLENDSRPIIRLHGAWALGQIGGSRARLYLEKTWQKDKEPAVRMEAEWALEHRL